jgi:hypothetical protein
MINPYWVATLPPGRCFIGAKFSIIMKNPWIFPVATLLVGAVGGYISGKNTSPSADPNASAGTPSIKTRSSARGENSSADAATRRSSRGMSVTEITQLPGSNNRIQALMDFYAGLTPEQFEEEARKLENMPMNERMMASLLLFGRWGETDPTAAMSFASTLGFTAMFVRPTILQSWASVDPANAAKYYAANPREFASMGMMGGGRGPMGGQGAASVIAAEWAKQDPAAALAWANSLTTEKSQALESILGEVAKTDPKRASEMVASMSGDLGDAYRTIASRYGASNFSEAEAWIRTLPADQQARALASAIGGLSNNDPEAAAAKALAMEAGENRDRVVDDIVEDLARLNPQLAADFLKKQDSEEALREGMRELMPSWVAKNPAAALAFANSYEPGPVRDSAIQSYIWSNNTAAPAELIRTAETITDEGDRTRSVAITAARWMREDEAGARAYIEQTATISDEAKERILENRGFFGGGPGGGGPGGRGRGRD